MQEEGGAGEVAQQRIEREVPRHTSRGASSSSAAHVVTAHRAEALLAQLLAGRELDEQDREARDAELESMIYSQ